MAKIEIVVSPLVTSAGVIAYHPNFLSVRTDTLQITSNSGVPKCPCNNRCEDLTMRNTHRSVNKHKIGEQCPVTFVHPNPAAVCRHCRTARQV